MVFTPPSYKPFPSEEAKVGEAEQAELAKLYFKYLLEKISTRIHEDTLRQEVLGMLDRERRPVTDFLELQNELAKTGMYPARVNPSGLLDELLVGLFDNKNPITSDMRSVCMFNEDWTAAYVRVMTKRISDDIFRIMTVRLMEPLV